MAICANQSTNGGASVPVSRPGFGITEHFCLYPRVSGYRGLSILTPCLILLLPLCAVDGSAFHVGHFMKSLS